MKNLTSRIILLASLAVVLASALTLNSCRDKTITQWDTLFVHDTIPCPDSSVWISRNAGTNENLVISLYHGNTGYIGGVHGVMLGTNDAGSTWQLLSSAPVFNSSYGPGAVYGLGLAGASLLATGDQRMLVGSNDNGYSWNPMNTTAVPTSDLIRSMYFVNATRGYVGTSDAYAAPSGWICATTDGGQTWNPIFNANGGIYNIDFNGTNGVAQGRFGVNYWSSDNGQTWNPGTSDVPNAMLYRTAFTSATTGFAVASESETLGYILKTTDAGHSWHTIKTTNVGLQGIAFNGTNRITAVGFSGMTYESKDGGSTWHQQQVGTNRWLDIRYPTPNRAIIIGENGRIYTCDH